MIVLLAIALIAAGVLAAKLASTRAKLGHTQEACDIFKAEAEELPALRAELADSRARLEMSEAEKARLLGERKEESQSLRQIGELRREVSSIKDEKLPALLERSSKAADGADRVLTTMLGWTQGIANPQSRGAFGELAVENQLQSLGLEPGRDYFKQLANDDGSKRPDYIVRTGQGSVIIDAKFVLDDGLQGFEEALGERDEERLIPFGRKLKGRIEDLSKRNYSQLGGSGVTAVLLYIPVQGAQAALRALPGFSLEKFTRQHRVYVVTPQELPIAIGLVAEIAHVARRDEGIEETARQLLDMAEAMSKFCAGLDQHGKHLGTAVDSYNKLVGTVTTRGKLGLKIKSVLEFAGRRPQEDGEVRQLTPPRDDAGEAAERWAAEAS